MTIIARRRLFVVLAGLVAMLCMGMGGTTSTDMVKRIPQPDRSFTVYVVDVEDVSYVVEDFSVDGMTMVPVFIGRAEASIDFANVSSVAFIHSGKKLVASVSFRDGDEREVTVNPDTQFYGRVKWGLMRLAARDIRSLTFRGTGANE
ncbi:hypothetical protein GGQ74_002398 [Desulfobaculum xiamenense]|uniref:Uncharacterized protein n=1 Tax=Desulfobaculum xiamenense TaxID=995050 RepID=A0A846QTD2_9BACT|nr:hypothetical protein [Desulfobaculum xiamenense]NJB68725.1 hypothetical protein [Desulfobaculum xiamenense]